MTPINMKRQIIRGGAAKFVASAATFSVRIGSLVVLSRLLEPKDFGLVAMVTSIIGVLNLFRDFGLSAASVQQESISDEQRSTLFWINLLVGAILTILSAAGAPVIALFYKEPRLVLVTALMSLAFLINAAGVQHSAQLQRQMKFTTLATIDIVALAISALVGIAMAAAGYGYWALVATTLTPPVILTSGLWLATGWIPGMPHRNVGMSSMLRFGGMLTLTWLVTYFAYNLEKVLLGRFWGTEALGMYGRAYQLANIPTENLNSIAGEMAFAGLSRVRHEPVLLRGYFLKGYSLVLALTVPITIVCGLFADDLIRVVLGPKWNDVGPVFRLLTPTILVFAAINPLRWLLGALGLVKRSLRMSIVLAPILIGGYLAGLPFGSKGVATAYSVIMVIWMVPHLIWCIRDTVISPQDIAGTLSKPALSGAVAGTVAFVAGRFFGDPGTPLLRLAAGVSSFSITYVLMLLWVMGQRTFYVDLLRGFMAPAET